MEYLPDEFARGENQSAADIASGQPRLYWQTRGAWGELLTRLMAEEFAVAVEHTSDITTQAQNSYRAGYNRATAANIDATFGTGSYQRVIDEITRLRDDQYQKYLRSQEQAE